MSFYPMFIPMGGGGGGGPIWPNVAAVVLILGGAVGFIEYMSAPKFHFDIKKSGTQAKLICVRKNYPTVQRITHHNTECLAAKGYEVYTNKFSSVFSLSENIVSKSDLDIAQLLEDCKECNTYTEFDYYYRPIFSNKEVDATKRLNWSACNVRRELK